MKRLDGVVRSMLFEATGKRACTRAGLLKVCLIVKNSKVIRDRQESGRVSKDTWRVCRDRKEAGQLKSRHFQEMQIAASRIWCVLTDKEESCASHCDF